MSRVKLSVNKTFYILIRRNSNKCYKKFCFIFFGVTFCFYLSCF